MPLTIAIPEQPRFVGNKTITGSLTVGGQTKLPAGTAANPALLINDAAGWFADGSGRMCLGVGGNSTAWLLAGINNLRLQSAVEFGWASGDASATGADVKLFRDAAGVLAQRNGTNAQQFNVYATYADTSNYERVELKYSGSRFQLVQRNLGSGSARVLEIGTSGAAVLEFFTNNVNCWRMDTSGNFLGITDNTYDIGASGATRPRSLHVGTNILVGVAAVGTSGVGVLALGNGTVPSTSPADMVQLFSTDITAGNASLGLRTEKAVDVGASVLSTHTLSITVNGTVYKVLLSNV